MADLPRIGPILFDLLTGVAVPTQADAERELEPFLDMVREHTGIDFHSYKAPTILRRLQRRIIAVGTSDLAGYTKYLEQHPEEYQRLASSFLIKVTDFMRDPELFDVMRERIIPDLVAASQEGRRGQNGNELRFWSAGCATGEEAYSLAILVLEALGDDLSNYSVKIFATDLDADAIAFARHGIYPASALAHVPEDLVERYFTRSNRGYEVKKLVRSIVVFGEHDLGQRAPFPRIDMVLCRNVLIYFTRELQQRALQLFAFSLREGGYLVLGTTETVSPAPTFFTPDLAKLKIFRRHGKEQPTPPFHVQGYALTSEPAAPSGFSAHPTPATTRSERRLPTRNVRRSDLEAARELWQAQQESLQARTFKENLLLNLPIGVVVVDRRYDIHEINSTARRLLGIHTVAIGEDLLHLAQNVPTKSLRGAIDRAIREKRVTRLNDVQIPQMVSGEPAFLQIDCYPQTQQEPRPDVRSVEKDSRKGDGKSTVDGPVENVLLLTPAIPATTKTLKHR